MLKQSGCYVCDETRLVCEAHPDRPWSGKYACGCGVAAMACPTCSRFVPLPQLNKGFETKAQT
jgi:hypothetical protein